MNGIRRSSSGSSAARRTCRYNCLDRHLDERGNKYAIIWEGEPGDERKITYRGLHKLVCRFANVLKDAGYKAGDKAILYMPMVPELPVAMLACARLGIMHSVVFGGFSAEALKLRIQDLGATLVITADGGWRRGKEVRLKDAVDEALEECPGVKDCVVLKRTGSAITMKEGRDSWWHELEAQAGDACEAVPLDSEHPLFALYTSGTTGKPKGILHTTGGYILGATMTVKWVFDIKDDDVYWCAADIGWITGHSYIVYGPLSAGATTVMYEGAPDTPAWDRWWQMVEKYKVNILYTSPTADPGASAPGRRVAEQARSVEPAPARLRRRAHQSGRLGVVLQGDRQGALPIVDTWWQTETGSIMIAPMPGAVPAKPGSATLPMPGVLAEVVDGAGKPVAAGEEGYLVIERPWPSMMRTIWGDPERYEQTYWSRVRGKYFTGDAARRDEDGYFWVLGRVDDVMNVSGHRLSTMEIESVLVRFPAVAEAAVVGTSGRDDRSGGLRLHHPEGRQPRSATSSAARCSDWIAHEIGKFARPKEIQFAEALPKTRSGKIMRRLLREIVTTNKVTGDITTLEDLSVVNRLSS